MTKIASFKKLRDLIEKIDLYETKIAIYSKIISHNGLF